MGACPFCKGEVDDDVLTFGGRCPSCLIEIPGEEAPTDPGAEARAAREAAEAAAKKPPTGKIVGLAVALLAVGVGGFMFMPPAEQPLPDVPTGAEAYKKVSSQFVSIDLDDEDDTPEPVADTPSKPTKPSKPAGTSTSTKPPKKPIGSGLPDTENLGSADIDDVPLTDAGDARPSDAYEPPVAKAAAPSTEAQTASVLNTKRGGGSDLLNADIGGPPRDRMYGEEYCGEEMREPVKLIMKQLGKQLRDCSTRMLKKDDKFSSSVKVSIAVDKTGKIAAIDLRPSNTDDPEFLGCIEKTIKKQTFPRFCTGVDLAKTYYFGSQR